MIQPSPLPAGVWPDPSASFRLLGVRIDTSGFEGTLRGLLDAPRQGRRLSVHFTTAHLLTEARRDSGLRALLNYDDSIVTADGMPLVWAGKMAHRPADRVCSPDIMPALLDRGRSQGARHFFYGATPEVLAELERRMMARFPGLRVAGTFSPPFRPLTPAEDREAVERIEAASPDYVWVGLGAPKQDWWVADHRPRLSAAALLAVGAAFDMHAGRLRLAPQWMQRNGLEWAYRLRSEPRRLWKRYTVTNARFVAAIAADHAVPAAARRLRGR